MPFYAEELLSGLVRSGALVREEYGWRVPGPLTARVPDTMGESVRDAFGSLTPAGRRTLPAAALLGRRFDWRLLPEVTGLGREQVAAALREAADARLLTGEAGELVFRHALVRDQVLALLLPSDHEIFGARALTAVERAHPGLPGSWCELAGAGGRRPGPRRGASGGGGTAGPPQGRAGERRAAAAPRPGAGAARAGPGRGAGRGAGAGG